MRGAFRENRRVRRSIASYAVHLSCECSFRTKNTVSTGRSGYYAHQPDSTHAPHPLTRPIGAVAASALASCWAAFSMLTSVSQSMKGQPGAIGVSLVGL